jgi:hypothetical protein
MTRGTSARYVRGLGAALVATATLLLAANAGPARAETVPPAHSAGEVRPADTPQAPATADR